MDGSRLMNGEIGGRRKVTGGLIDLGAALWYDVQLVSSVGLAC